MTAARLVAVGDVSFADNPVNVSFGIDSLLRQHPNLDLFEHVTGVLRGHDIVFGNLETVLSTDGFDPTSARSRYMRGRPEAVAQLVRAGFNVINVANNHTLQHGARAFEETVDRLRASGIAVVGIAGRDGFNCEPTRVRARGMEVVFLGYAFEPDKYYPGVPLYAQTDLAGIVADIRRVKTSSNVVVCSYHWGREFVSYPSLDQIAIARGAIEAGCDLILGHHPHVLNGFEQYGKGYAFFSLGNFVFDQPWNEECTKSMAIYLELAPGQVQFTGAASVRIGRDYRPVVVDDGTFQDRLRTLSAQIEETIRLDGVGYARAARRQERSNRYRSWLYLVSHLRRYDPVILRQILVEAVMRRLRPDQMSTPSESQHAN
jgi:poly-gamma-glutamate synthesis protein (capsule biosynthesis protein)